MTVVTPTELLETCSRIGGNKASALDATLNGTLNLAPKSISDMFAALFEAYMPKRIFHTA